jgi:RNA polymerase sigma-70 factor, ECF subfamily
METPGQAPPTPLDSEIIAAAVRGEREAAARLLVDAHAAALGRACMALLGSQSEAEAALRETLEEALNGLPTFRGESSLRVWLSSIARRRCARRSEAQPSATVAASADQIQPAARARRLLSDVRPTEREALVLRFVAELGIRDVGTACGVDEATAQQRVSRGLSRLRGSMGEDES